MAQKKKTGKKPSGKAAPGKSGAADTLNKEIKILITALICIVLFLCVIDVAGSFGSAVRSVICGLFGALGYVFPFILGAVTIYLILRKKENGSSGILKIICGILLFICLCALASLLDSMVASGNHTVAEFYKHGASGFNGGLVGGWLTSLMIPKIGLIASYIIFVFLTLIFFVLLTGKSILRPIKDKGERVRERTREDMDYARQKRELRDLERKNHRAKKLEERREALRQQGVPDDLRIGDAPAAPIVNENERELNIYRGSEKTSVKMPARQTPRQTFEAEPEKKETAKTDEAGHAAPATSPAVGVVNSWTDALSKDYYEEPRTNVPEELYENTEEQAGKTEAAQPESIWSSGGYKESSFGAVFSKGTPAAQKPRVRPKKTYRLPPVSLLEKAGKSSSAGNAELRATAAKLERTLRSFDVGAAVTDISCGPTVTRYELVPDEGVKVARIQALKNDITLALAASDIRIEAPIPGKAAVGIEVPNPEGSIVRLREILESDKFKNAKSKLAFGLGKDIAGGCIVSDIAKMPHVLIAGATGSGKSVCLNTIILSILYRATPDEVKFIMIDPKQVELTLYSGIPHLLVPVVTDAKKAAGALNWGVAEMDQRYKKFADLGVKEIHSYNEKIVELQQEYDRAESHEPDEERPEKLPELIIIVDEMADLMMVAAHEAEEAIVRLAQLARAAGIHLVLATQRPSVKVVTGLIKANIPSRIALAVSSGIESRIIIDQTGAENLIGKGDMLYNPQWLPKPVRVQGAYVDDDEVLAVAEFWANQRDESYNAKQKTLAGEIAAKSLGAVEPGPAKGETDELFEPCARYIIENEKASIGNLQRRFQIGFNRAARIMDSLSEAGVVGPEEGKKPREVLMTMEEFDSYMNSINE